MKSIVQRENGYRIVVVVRIKLSTGIELIHMYNRDEFCQSQLFSCFQILHKTLAHKMK